MPATARGPFQPLACAAKRRRCQWFEGANASASGGDLRGLSNAPERWACGCTESLAQVLTIRLMTSLYIEFPHIQTVTSLAFNGDSDQHLASRVSR